jgi:uncharacterized protein YgiM (DUF1202 family)
MQKGLSLALASLFIGSSFSIADAAETKKDSSKELSLFSSFTGKVNRNRVRMRTDSSLESSIVREIDRGELLVVVGETNEFYEVQPPEDLKAYVFRSYLIDDVVEASQVNVRLAPNLESPVLLQLNPGDRVQGKIAAENSKWMEIKIPSSVRFYVAKEYLEKAGGPNLIAEMAARKQEAFDQLSAAIQESKMVMNQSFNKIDIEPVKAKLTDFIETYNDYPEQVEQAKDTLALLLDTYLQKKINYLEEKASLSTTNWDQKNKALDSEMAEFNAKFAELEQRLQMLAAEEAAKTNGSGSAVASGNRANSTEASGHVESTIVIEEEILPTPEFELNTAPMTFAEQEQMREQLKDASFAMPATIPEGLVGNWKAAEQTYFAMWAKCQSKGTIQDFYIQERLNAETLQGVIKPYAHSVKNKPGDYLLVDPATNRTLAFLYSTKVNLDMNIGKEVKLKAAARPNNHFAFPAFHVISVE